VALVGGPMGPFDAVLDGVTVERIHEVGIVVERATGRVDRVTVRDVLPQAADQLGGTGISVQTGVQSGMPDVVIDRSSIADTPGFGISVADAAVTVDRSILRRARPLVAEDLFGDGAIVASFEGVSSLALSRSRSEDHARAGLSNFAATASVRESVFECNDVDLDGEPTEVGDFTFVDEGDNQCGCDGALLACKVRSTNLLPPLPP